MNPCLLVLQEFGALQTSLLKHNRRLKQRDSLPLNATRGAAGFGIGGLVQEPRSGRGSGGCPEAEAFCIFAHNKLI